MKRVDLVMKIQNVLKAKKNHGDYKGKSCVSWLIKGEGISNEKIIWEGEAVVIENQAGKKDE